MELFEWMTSTTWGESLLTLLVSMVPVIELREDYGIAVYPIVTVREIIAFLHNRELDGRVYIDDEMKGRMEAYLEQYGAR